MGSFQITKANVINLKQNSLPFGYDWSFVALDYGKTAGDLLLVRPRVIGSHPAHSSKPRNPKISDRV